MGGKTSTSTSGVSIPPAVLSQYQSVNAAATQTAAQPFQSYGTAGATNADGTAQQFVAPTTATQNAGIANTNAAANEAQPAYAAAQSGLASTQANTTGVNNAALGLTAASAQAVDPTALTSADINQYMSPYLQDVVGSESALLNQNNQQQQSGQMGTAISSGAFGGDRSGVAAANLAQQQSLSNASIYSGLLNTGYNNALSTAQQQQGVDLSAAQANRTALGAAGNQLASIGSTAYGEGANTATTEASLGAGAQTAALQGANAQIAAGTVQQQTQQAQDTAEYNQFEQQQSYPFQVDQFLANIAEGTGALSGSTTTTTQPGGFFSDERLKEDKRPVGKTFDGQTIYSYKMKGDPRTRMGLMAGEVEDKHPNAVGLAAGYKTVDYGKATEKAANKSHFYSGGVVPIRKAGGGGASDPYDMQAILQAQQQMYAGLGAAHQESRVPAAQSGSHQLAVSNAPASAPPSGVSKVNQSIGLGQKGYQAYNHFAGATPSSGVGVAGADPQYLDAAQGALDSGGGADAAATGAADTAGVGAADSAAAGAGSAAAGSAATGAAADAAGTAAADAAAALAAEYVAADAGVALAAAKRGGAIRRGLASGGMPYQSSDPGTPYGDTGGDLDVPDEENTNKLKAAPGAGKQPTGLQTLMTLGTQEGASNAIGGMFSNEALAAGGRIGKGDGGGLDPIEVDSTAPDPVTYAGGVDASSVPTVDPGAPSAPIADSAGLAPAKADDKKDGPSWWDRNKGNVIPALEGLAAMGTAPTRSWGRALATGLGAGAEAYVPTQEGLANAGLTQQKARNEGYQADLMQAANNVAIPALAGTRSPAAGSPASTPGAGTPNGAAPYQPTAPAPTLAQQLRQKYQNPPLTAEEAQKVQQANYLSAATKNPAWTTAAETAPKNRAIQTSYANQQDAQNNYDNAVQTYNATKDTNPTMAASAAATADAYQQYTGDEPMTGAGGVQLNKRTKEPYIGTQAQRLSPEAYTQLATQLDQKVDVPAGDPDDAGKTVQISGYQKMGYPTRKAAIDALVPAGTPGVPGTSASAPRAAATPPAVPTRTAPPVRAPLQGAMQPSTPTATATLARPDQPTVPVNGIPAPLVQKAFTDPTYFPRKTANQLGTTFGSATKEKSDAEAKRSVALQDFASETATTSGSAMQYIDAAQKILNSKGAPVTGAWGPVAKQISRVLGTADANNYEEVSKQLINLAVQSGKSNFPNATQKEVGIQLEQASPATDQTGPALRNLLNETKRITQYNLDTSNLALKYLDKNGKALRFGDWNQEYHPKSEAVNQTTAPAAAIQHLKAHPELSDAFKAKYGYLPP